MKAKQRTIVKNRTCIKWFTQNPCSLQLLCLARRFFPGFDNPLVGQVPVPRSSNQLICLNYVSSSITEGVLLCLSVLFVKDAVTFYMKELKLSLQTKSYMTMKANARNAAKSFH
jgi:hypothetical protein